MNDWNCDECDDLISDGVYRYSLALYKIPLCRKCQNYEKYLINIVKGRISKDKIFDFCVRCDLKLKPEDNHNPLCNKCYDEINQDINFDKIEDIDLPQNETFNYIDFLYNKNIHYFNRIEPIDNLSSILKLGILSRNEVISKNIDFKDVSWVDVQKCRALNFKDIHNYVPLYFAKHTPMLYVLSEWENKKFKLAIIKINLKVLEEDKVFFTNISCSRNDKDRVIYKNPESLKELNWEIINTRSGNTDEYKKYKSAEVLVFERVDIKYISLIVVADDIVKNNIVEKYKAINPEIIKVDYDEFNWDVEDD